MKDPHRPGLPKPLIGSGGPGALAAPDDALAVPDIDAAGDDDRGAGSGRPIGYIAEDGIAQEPGTDDLAIGERRQHRGRRPAEGLDQQEMTEAAEETHQRH